MAYNLGTIRAQVRTKLSDDNYDASTIDQEINNFQRELTNRHKYSFMETTSNLTYAQGEHSKPLPSDYSEVSYVYITSPKDDAANLTNRYLDNKQFLTAYPAFALEDESPPNRWTILDGNLVFSAPVEKSYTIVVRYLKVAAELSSDSDVPDVPEEFSEVLVLGALTRIMKIEEDYALSNQELVDLNNMITDMNIRYGQGERVKGPIRMRTARG